MEITPNKYSEVKFVKKETLLGTVSALGIHINHGGAIDCPKQKHRGNVLKHGLPGPANHRKDQNRLTECINIQYTKVWTKQSKMGENMQMELQQFVSICARRIHDDWKEENNKNINNRQGMKALELATLH